MAQPKAPAIPDQMQDQLLSGASASTAFDQGGLLDQLKKALAERALNAEMGRHMAGGGGNRNSSNGYGRKSVVTDTGRIALDIPRDRQRSFDPVLIAKYQRRVLGFYEKILSMYARGMSTREIAGHLKEFYDIEGSPDLVSTVGRLLLGCRPNPVKALDLDGSAAIPLRITPGATRYIVLSDLHAQLVELHLIRKPGAPNCQGALPLHHAAGHDQIRRLGGGPSGPSSIAPWRSDGRPRALIPLRPIALSSSFVTVTIGFSPSRSMICSGLSSAQFSQIQAHTAERGSGCSFIVPANHSTSDKLA